MLASKKSTLIGPFDEERVDLIAPAESIDDLKAHASRLPSIQITRRRMSELELLANGAYHHCTDLWDRETMKRSGYDEFDG